MEIMRKLRSRAIAPTPYKILCTSELPKIWGNAQCTYTIMVIDIRPRHISVIGGKKNIARADEAVIFYADIKHWSANIWSLVECCDCQ